jgi:transcriptional regulator with XRE-family HTH domain
MSNQEGSPDPLRIVSEQIRAARALLRWEQADLATAAELSLPTIKRAERTPGLLQVQPRTARDIVRALEAAGVEFIPENGGGPGVRLRK